MVYLDNAATTLRKPRCVIDAVADAMRHLGNAGRGAHEVSLDASRMIYDTRARLCRLFGAEDPEQVAFASNATAALNTAIQGIFVPGDHVITTQLEHNSVLRPLYYMEKQGVELTILPADRQGNIDYTAMEEAVRPHTRGIVCTHASNVTGNLTDLSRIGEICRRHNLVFIVDAAQTAGIHPIRMDEMNIGAVCFTGHKSLMGPQGTGGIAVRRNLSVRPLMMGGSGVQSYSREHPARMPAALEAGTLNGHGIAGLNAALRWLEARDMSALRRREQELMWNLYDGVSKIPGVTVYGDFSDRSRDRAPIVSLNIRGCDSSQVSDELSEAYGIQTRPGAHCAPLMHEALGTAGSGAVRFSISHTNTEEEIQKAIQAVRQLASES